MVFMPLYREEEKSYRLEVLASLVAGDFPMIYAMAHTDGASVPDILRYMERTLAYAGPVSASGNNNAFICLT